MKATTASLPKCIIKDLDKLKKTGLFTSRSEVVRIAIFNFFKEGINKSCSNMLKTLEYEQPGHNIVPLSLPPQMINKLNEFVLNDPNNALESRSFLIFQILKKQLPGLINATRVFFEPIVIQPGETPVKRNNKSKEFDMRCISTSKMIDDILKQISNQPRDITPEEDILNNMDGTRRIAYLKEKENNHENSK